MKRTKTAMTKTSIVTTIQRTKTLMRICRGIAMPMMRATRREERVVKARVVCGAIDEGVTVECIITICMAVRHVYVKGCIISGSWK